MKIPEQITGKHRLRDLAICLDYIEGLTVDEIMKKRTPPFTSRRCHQILWLQKDFINSNIGWSKSKRLHTLMRCADKAGIELTQSKDVLNIIEQMRKEIEGEKPLVENHLHLNVVSNLHDAAKTYSGNGKLVVDNESDTEHNRSENSLSIVK